MSSPGTTADSSSVLGGVISATYLKSRPSAVTGLLAFALTVLAIAVAWVINRILKSRLIIKPVVQSKLIKANGEGYTVQPNLLPPFSNGDEFGYSVWVYIDQWHTTSYPKAVLTHGHASLEFGATDNNAVFTLNRGGDVSTEVSASMPYVPLQRWVHIVVVYADETLHFFRDGEIDASVALDRSSLPGGRVSMVPSGAFALGGPRSFNGFIGSTAVLNFYPSARDIKSLYKKGPSGVSSWLQMMGLGAYGLRSPIYRIDNI